jgi:putative PIN family toxin of toxin-antitoxin system
MRVVLDTNVAVRVFTSVASNAAHLWKLLSERRHSLVVSLFLLDELRRVLRYDRIKIIHRQPESAMERFVLEYKQLAELVELPPQEDFSVTRDSNDDLVLLTAAAGRADCLCTGDRDLHTPEAHTFARQFGFLIVTEVELLEVLSRSRD